MSAVLKRFCDICQVEYDENNYAWMIMQTPNAPEVMEIPEYDFCSWDCIVQWVNSEENDDSLSQETDNHTPPPANLKAVQVQDMPRMSLADALASGQMSFPNSRDDQS